MPILKHFRGGLYNLLFEGKAAAPILEGERVGIYISLQDGKVWVRSDFFEPVRVGNGLAVVPSRFTLLSPDNLEREAKEREKKLGIKPRGWLPRRSTKKKKGKTR